MLLATSNMGRSAWHMAAKKNNLDVLQNVLEWAEEKLTTEEINNKLLLATEGKGRTVWHRTVKCGNFISFRESLGVG